MLLHFIHKVLFSGSHKSRSNRVTTIVSSYFAFIKYTHFPSLITAGDKTKSWMRRTIRPKAKLSSSSTNNKHFRVIGNSNRKSFPTGYYIIVRVGSVPIVKVIVESWPGEEIGLEKLPWKFTRDSWIAGVSSRKCRNAFFIPVLC
jgi:hypothetical protein